MDHKELMRGVRLLEIKTRRLVDGALTGHYHAAFKGRGMQLAEVREYSIGDEVRDIDWSVTARTGKPHVKVWEEERELTMMLLIDVSASAAHCGTSASTLRERCAEIAATLALSALRGGDKVGLVLFTDKVELYIPAARGRGHILRLIREMLSFEPTGRQTDLRAPLEFIMRVMKKRCIAFLLSDFISPHDYTAPLNAVAARHDLVAIRCSDTLADTLPNVGLVNYTDAETGSHITIDTSSPQTRARYRALAEKRREEVRTLFAARPARYMETDTRSDFVMPLMALLETGTRR